MNLRKARLADIEVDEVSFVDRAANKRKFLFMKRDNSEDETKGGENLELLKAFKNDEDVIAALEGIEENLVKVDQALSKKLEEEDLTDEQREMLLEKKAEYEALKEELEDGFEQLFLDKAAFSGNGGSNGKSNGKADDGVDSEEKTNTDETDGGDDENATTANPTSSGKGGKGKGGGTPKPLAGVQKKKKPAADEEDAEDEADGGDDEATEDEAPAGKKKPTKKSDDSEEESDEDAFDEEDQTILKSIQVELEKGEKLRSEVKEIQGSKS